MPAGFGSWVWPETRTTKGGENFSPPFVVAARYRVQVAIIVLLFCAATAAPLPSVIEQLS